MARREKGAEAPAEAPKLRAPPPVSPRLTAPAPEAPRAPAVPKPAPAVPTFPTPRVPHQVYTVIVCFFCASDDVGVRYTKPGAEGRNPYREYECKKCCLCPKCGAWNSLPVKAGRVVECRFCRPFDGSRGNLYEAENGSRFKIQMKKAQAKP